MNEVTGTQFNGDAPTQGSSPASCRSCSVCQGAVHHWLEHSDESFTGYLCKHCPARGIFELHGNSYVYDLAGEGEVSYIEDRSQGHRVDYLWELTGAHDGPPIRVWMLGVGEEWDEDGRQAGWERLVWADDESPFITLDGYLEDAYTDPLRDELQAIARETWS